jgi:hypothetical protein
MYCQTTNYQDMFGSRRLPPSSSQESVDECVAQTNKATKNKFHDCIAGGAGGVSSAIALTPFSRISTIQQTTLNADGGGKGTLPFFSFVLVKAHSCTLTLFT